MASNEPAGIASSTQQLRNYDDGICAICLNLHVNKSHPDCGHVFCFGCLVHWCRIKLECPTCKQPFRDFHHTIQMRPSCDQIYTPEPPVVESPMIQPISLIVISERGSLLQTWVLSDANRVVMIPMPLFTHERLNDPGFRHWFFNFLNREFNVNVVGIVRQSEGGSP